MRGRKLRWLLAVLAVLVVAHLIFWWPPSRGPMRITINRFGGIRLGMNREEAIALLGPPGDYSTTPVRFFREKPPLDGEILLWVSDEGIVQVAVDTSGQIVEGHYTDGLREPQSSFDNLLWRAKRQWRKWFP